MIDEQRCWELIDQLLDGSIGDSERTELSQILDSHPELASELTEQLKMHSLLSWRCRKIDPGNRPLLPRRQAPSASSPRSALKHLVKQKWLWAAVVIAAASLSIWAGPLYFSRNPIIAEVVDEQVVEWREGFGPPKDRSIVSPRSLEMKSGMLAIRFHSGATLSVSGDVSMQVQSEERIRLDRGCAVAQVSQAARGFTILAPYVRVVDLGTNFGVVAGDDRPTQVAVFSGTVELSAGSHSTSNFHEKLAAGEGVQVGPDGLVARLMNVRRNSKGTWSSVDKPLSSDATIVSVRDNLDLSRCRKYYELIPRGLRDDAPAYVDSHAQWNGLMITGLPDFLRDADYVKTFDDMQVILDLTISVQLSRPAMLYVLFDRRAAPPRWLTSQFEDTGADIGLDAADEFDVQNTIAVGAGQSIDHVFSVWQKRCPTPGIVQLGPAGDKSWRPRSAPADEGGENPPRPRGMYGIAAKPLD